MFFELFVAQAATMPADPAPAGWLNYVLTLLAAIVTAVVIPWLKNEAARARAEADKHRVEAANLSNLTASQVAEAFKSEAYALALTIAEKRFPSLAANIRDGHLRDIQSIKAELRGWGEEAKAQLIATFKLRGVDVVSLLGDKAIDNAIRWAADRVSPFPGKDTAVALLTDNVSNLLINKGVQFVRGRYLEEAKAGDPSVNG
jgi:hypothetical protein